MLCNIGDMLCNDLVAHRAFVIFSSDPSREASVDDFWSGRLTLEVAEKYLAMGRKPHYYWINKPGLVPTGVPTGLTIWALRDLEKCFLYSGYCVGCQHTDCLSKVVPALSIVK